MVEDVDVVATLPESARGAFKDPLGPVETDAAAVVADAEGQLIAVGDVVTYHLLNADRRPDVAVVDGRTKREPVDEAIADALDDGDVEVANPAGTLTAALLDSLRDAIAAGEPRTIRVDGEEDLAVLPAILCAPTGASVVYGQPGEGMVHVRVDGETRDRVRDLVGKLEGDHERLLALCGLE